MALLTAEEEPVWVVNSRTGETIEARIDKDGYVREKNGAGAFSEGTYELLVVK